MSEHESPSGPVDLSARKTALTAGPFLEGDVLDLRIADLAYGGAGLARAQGLTFFVAGAVPGDVARVRVRSRKRNYAEADLIEIQHPSPDRVAAPCAHFGACGGCHWMNLAYERQIAHKERQLTEALTRLGKLEGYVLWPIVPSPEILGYRNRMEFEFAPGPDGLLAGLHRRDDPATVEGIRECHLQVSGANEILNWVVAALRERSPPSDRFFRRLTIRRSSPADRFLVALTTREGPLPEGPAMARAMMKRFPRLSGVVRRIIDADGWELSVRKLAGDPALHEEIAGLSLTVTSGAFLQVNSRQAERLYRKVEEFAAIASNDRVLDLYCGVGAITLLLARSAKRATGVDDSEESIRCAGRNALANGLPGCSFLLGDARRTTIRMAGGGESFDAVVLNPPRAGLPGDLVAAVSKLSANRIVYVSCNPTTLARDLARFRAGGYRTTDVASFDMFPQTFHIEAVARLERESNAAS